MRALNPNVTLSKNDSNSLTVGGSWRPVCCLWSESLRLEAWHRRELQLDFPHTWHCPAEEASSCTGHTCRRLLPPRASCCTWVGPCTTWLR